MKRTLLILISLLILIPAPPGFAAVPRIVNSKFTTNATPAIAQSEITGLPAALAAKLGTNQNPVLNPLMFGAVADGTTDDTLAWSNAIVALNAGSRLVLDGLGKKYRITAPLPTIMAQSATIQNGVILYDSPNGVVFSKTNRNHTGVFPAVDYAAQFTIQNMGIYQVNGNPNPGNVAICLGDGVVTNSLSYGVNYNARNNVITNFWQGFVVSGGVQANIEYNSVYKYWSNAVFAMGAIDQLRIAYNNFDNRDGTFASRHTNAIIIHIEPWQAVHVDVTGNNMGGAKQAFKGSDIARLDWAGNQAEGFWTIQTNLTKLEAWNTTVFMEGDGFPGGFGQSNYLATVGLYAFGSGRIYLDKSEFRGLNQGFSFDVFSTNTLDAPYFFPKSTAATTTVRRHAAWGDAGTLYTFADTGTDNIHFYNGTNRTFLNLFGNLRFQTGGSPWGEIAMSGNAATITGSTLFNGTVTAGTPAVQGLGDRGGAPTTWDLFSQYKQHWRLLSVNASTVDFSGSNGVLRAHSTLNLLNGFVTSGGASFNSGTGTPEGAVTANVGSLYTRTDGGAGTTLYVKESGTGNTGWVAK